MTKLLLTPKKARITPCIFLGVRLVQFVFGFHLENNERSDQPRQNYMVMRQQNLLAKLVHRLQG